MANEAVVPDYSVSTADGSATLYQITRHTSTGTEESSGDSNIFIRTKTDHVFDSSGNTLTSKLSTLSTGLSFTVILSGDVTGTANRSPSANSGNVEIETTIENDSHYHSGSTVSVETASRAIISDSEGYLNTSEVTATELSYVHGVTSAIQTQLNNKVSTSQIGAANGVAPLDSSSKVPAAYLPSFVDDVIEFYVEEGTITTGTDNETSEPYLVQSGNRDNIILETSKIYVNVYNNRVYRWSGTTLVQINDGVVLGTTAATAYRGDYGNTAYQHSQSAHARTDATAVSSSATNGSINIDGTDTVVYTHPTTEGNKHIPAGGSSGSFLKYSSAGTASWGTITLNDIQNASAISAMNTLASGNTTGLVRKSAADSWTLDTHTYLTDSDIVGISNHLIASDTEPDSQEAGDIWIQLVYPSDTE